MRKQSICILRTSPFGSLTLAIVLLAAPLPCTAAERIQVSEDAASRTLTFSLAQKPLAIYHNKLTPMPHVHFLYTLGGVNVIAGDSSKLPHGCHWGVFFGTDLSDAGKTLDFFHGGAKQIPSAVQSFQASTKVLLKERRSIVMYQHADLGNATVLEWQTELSCPEGTDKVLLRGYDFVGLGVRMLNAAGGRPLPLTSAGRCGAEQPRDQGLLARLCVPSRRGQASHRCRL